MGFVASYILSDGSRGIRYFSSREEIEEFKRRGAKLSNIREKRVIKRIYTDEYGRVHEERIDTRTGKVLPIPIKEQADEILRREYHISLEELQRIVATSKSQPEALHKLRLKLHGSTRYDPRFHEVENLLNQLWDAKAFSWIPETKSNLQSTLRSMVVRRTPGAIVENGKIVIQKPLPMPRRPPEAEIERNTGVKTVPVHHPKPSVVIKPVAPKLPTVHAMVEQSQPEQKKTLPSWVIPVGVLVGLYIISRRR